MSCTFVTLVINLLLNIADVTEQKLWPVLTGFNERKLDAYYASDVYK